MRIQKVNQPLPDNQPVIAVPRNVYEIDQLLRQTCQRHHFHYTSAFDPAAKKLNVQVRRFADSTPTFELQFDGGRSDAVILSETMKILNGQVVSELWPPIHHIARVNKSIPGKGVVIEDVPVAFWRRFVRYEYSTTCDLRSASEFADGNYYKPVKTEQGWVGLSKVGKEVVRFADGVPNPLAHEAEAIMYNGESGKILSVLVGVSEKLRKEVADLESRAAGAKVVTPPPPKSEARRELEQAMATRNVTAAGTSAASTISVTPMGSSAYQNKAARPHSDATDTLGNRPTKAPVAATPKVNAPNRDTKEMLGKLSTAPLSDRHGLQTALKNLGDNAVKLSTKEPNNKPAIAKPVASTRKPKVGTNPAPKKAAVKKAPVKKATTKTLVVKNTAPKKAAVKKKTTSKASAKA